MIILLLVLLSTPLTSGDEFCGKRLEREAGDRNAEWYPQKCATEVQPLGQRCHLKCKEGYSFNEGALMFTDCIKTDSMEWSDLNLSSDICHRSDLGCTVPEVPHLYGACEPGQSVQTGQICYVNCSQSQRVVGPTYITCQESGEWSGNGSYCKATEPVGKMECPKLQVLLNTDTHSSTVDARRFLNFPKLQELNPSQLELLWKTNNSNIIGLTKGQHLLTYKSEVDTCEVFITVEDKEPPVLVNCVEAEERFSIPKYHAVIKSSNCTFEDNIDGIITGKHKNPSIPQEFRPGLYRDFSYIAIDSSGNEKESPVVYNVLEKDCRTPYPVENSYIENFQNNIYQTKCVNESYSTYAVYGANLLPFSNLFDVLTRLRQFTNPCNITTFITKFPALECYYKFPKQNGTCPTGQVPYGSICVPCPKSFYYNESSSQCLLCPPNTTTHEQGNSTCVPCPKNSMTVETKGPIRCEYFCKPGEAYTISGCSKCSVGEYVEAGGETCKRCPVDTVTLFDSATSVDDCKPGVLMDLVQGEIGVAGKPNDTFYFRFDLLSSQIPQNQLEQRVGIRFKSTYLSSMTNCSEDFVQLVGYFGQVENNLTEPLCGNALEEIYIRDFRPWRTNIIRYKFTNNSQSIDLKVYYGVGSKLCSSGSIFNLTSEGCEKCGIGMYQEDFNGFECKQCPDGKTNYGEGLTFCTAPCPPGFGGNKTGCIPCPMNTYEKNSTCVNCPDDEATVFERSTECLKACSLGERLSDGTCVKCPHGMYQPLTRHSQPVCRYCVAGRTTLSDGSTSIDSCVTQCHYEGHYYNTTLNSCQLCPKDTYKTASGFTVQQCTPCLAGTTTSNSGSIWKLNCQKKKLCELSNDCKFPGQCMENGTTTRCVCPKFHTGQFCETVDGPCSTSPCNNNGTCHPISKTNNYECLCKPGYTGRNCSSEHDPCDPNPCFKSNCTTVELIDSKWDYNCSCRVYWGGKRCTAQLQRPCTNTSICVHGTCDDDPAVHGLNNYTCECDRGYEGAYCDIEILHCNKNPCDFNGTKKCEEEAVGDRKCLCKAGYFGETCDQFKKCNAGEFYLDKECCKCWHGTYNPQSNAERVCKNCSDGLSTLNRGANMSNACEDVLKREKFSVEFVLSSGTYQGPLVKEGCGYLPTKLEKQMGDFLESKGEKNYAVKVDEYLPAPKGKNGLRVKVTVYGDNENNEKILREAVNSGKIGDFSVDKDYIKIVKDDKDVTPDRKEKTKLTWLYVLIPIVVIVIVVVCLVVCCRNKNKCPINPGKEVDVVDSEAFPFVDESL